MKKMLPGGNAVKTYDRSNNILFKDIGGNKQAKDSLVEIVDCLKNP